jgi:hypothetical protein
MLDYKSHVNINEGNEIQGRRYPYLYIGKDSPVTCQANTGRT